MMEFFLNLSREDINNQRSGVLWQNEAVEYVRANAAVKGRPNLTSVDFCKWVNESVLPNCTREPGFPRKVGLETARLWLHHLGFEVLTARKGIFIDGHERPDVIETRKLFLRNDKDWIPAFYECTYGKCNESSS